MRWKSRNKTVGRLGQLRDGYWPKVYAKHVVILMKVVGDEAENRKDWVEMDEFEEIFMGDERVNIIDDPRLPACFMK